LRGNRIPSETIDGDEVGENEDFAGDHHGRQQNGKQGFTAFEIQSCERESGQYGGNRCSGRRDNGNNDGILQISEEREERFPRSGSRSNLNKQIRVVFQSHALGGNHKIGGWDSISKMLLKEVRIIQ
jgi:hypothetical protein